jgi:hypothetical protein
VSNKKKEQNRTEQKKRSTKFQWNSTLFFARKMEHYFNDAVGAGTQGALLRVKKLRSLFFCEKALRNLDEHVS